jgi:Bacteriophage HK97-gp10, putative tail-component
MGSAVSFVVLDAAAPRKACAENIRETAERIASRAAALTPRATGLMASSWRTAPGYSDPATTVVVNDAPYARFVEYGTRRTRAHAPLGRALASGGG